jgi:LuxR family transcriptional regulator/LuxR family quorum-sensing system transcriptional regulator CciR
MGLQEFIATNRRVTTPDQLLASFARFMEGFGAECVSYHIIAAQLHRLNLEEGFILNRFPPDWVAHYIERRYFEIDPIISHAIVAEAPFRWYEIGRLVPLTAAQEAYIQDMKAWNFVDGFGIPIFGARSTIGYVGVGSRHAPLRVDEMDVLRMQYVSQFVHNRYAQLAGMDHHEPANLTPREREVLGWLVRGKSNSAIAGILGVSENTVDTLIRRCYRKLGVSDRVGAALKAVGAGLVSL